MIKFFRKIMSCVVTLLFLFGAFAILVFWQSYRFWLQSPNENAQVIMLQIKEGDGFGQIAQELEEQNIIDSDFWFRIYGRLDGSQRDIQVGTFELKNGMNYSEIIDVITNSETEEVVLTIPEGYTLEQIGALVTEKFPITEADWGLSTGMESKFETHPLIVWAEKPENVDLEGYLFPDTYRFYADSTADDIVEKLLDTMYSRIESISLTPPRDMTGHEWLTLSSIIEREVIGVEDKSIVADIFVRRLQIGMALQADSTVNYVTGKNTPGISLVDREIDSLYNTYKYPGLTPGPISNPGLESLTAVMNPTPNSFLYFLTTPEGEVKYALSHDDHVRNKQIYLP